MLKHPNKSREFAISFQFTYFYIPCSTWVIMNRETRRLSKIPEQVREEVKPFYLDRTVIKNTNDSNKIDRLSEETAESIRSGLAVSVIVESIKILFFCQLIYKNSLLKVIGYYYCSLLLVHCCCSCFTIPEYRSIKT